MFRNFYLHRAEEKPIKSHRSKAVEYSRPVDPQRGAPNACAVEASCTDFGSRHMLRIIKAGLALTCRTGVNKGPGFWFAEAPSVR